MTRAVKAMLARSGVLGLISRLTAENRVEILLYHGFCEGSRRDPQFPQLMPIAHFEEHLRILSKYGAPLRLEDLLTGASHGIVVTFDDGYANNYRLAFPLLEKYEVPATVFVATGFVDGAVPLWGDWLEFLCTKGLDAPRWSRTFQRAKDDLKRMSIDEIHQWLLRLQAELHVDYGPGSTPEPLQPLSWNEIRAMRRSGLVSFGAHTVSHAVLSQCPPVMQRDEIVRSRQRLEDELGEACVLFAYPYGTATDYTEISRQIVRESGFLLALTAEPGSNARSHPDYFELKRWGADVSSEDFGFLVAGGPVISSYVKHMFAMEQRCR